MSILFWNKLRSLQGVNISLDYTFEQDAEADGTLTYKADSFTVNVDQTPGILLSEFSVVNAILLVLNGDLLLQTWDLPLTFQGMDGDVITFASPAVTCNVGYATSTEKYITRGQVAVCIDKIWQIDPVQMNPGIPEWEPHNFNFDWLDATHAPYVLR